MFGASCSTSAGPVSCLSESLLPDSFRKRCESGNWWRSNRVWQSGSISLCCCLVNQAVTEPPAELSHDCMKNDNRNLVWSIALRQQQGNFHDLCFSIWRNELKGTLDWFITPNQSCKFMARSYQKELTCYLLTSWWWSWVELKQFDKTSLNSVWVQRERKRERAPGLRTTKRWLKKATWGTSPNL